MAEKNNEKNAPTFDNGKICYIEIPSKDIRASAEFYKKIFNWNIRWQDENNISFDDTIGEVSGRFVLNRKAISEAGLLIYMMVDDIIFAMDLVVSNGGKIVQLIGADAPEITARFNDPTGNLLGLYEERSISNKKQSSNALVITRTFNAPRELVWKAWTVPEHLMKWWGPKDFTSPVCKMDLRVGGKFLFCMQLKSDGKNYFSTGTYMEIIPFEKLVYTDSFADENGNVVSSTQHGLPDGFPPQMLVTITLEELNGKTIMTVRQVGMPAGKMKEMAFIGWNQSLDKLAESLK